MSSSILHDGVHPTLDGRPKELLIGGEWVPARSGELIESLNPSTGQPIAEISAGGAEDIDCAVSAAQNTLEGPWSKYTPAQRQDVLLKLASILEERFEELRLLDVLDMGAPISRPGGPTFLANVLRYYAGWATTARR